MNKYEKQYVITMTNIDEIFAKFMFKSSFQEEVLDLSKLFSKINKLDLYFDILLENITDVMRTFSGFSSVA